MSHTTGRGRMLRARGAALLVTTLVLAGGSIVVAPAAFAAPPAATITIDVAPAAATEGDSIEVTVTSTGTTDLYAYDLAIEFDPALLAFTAGSVAGPGGGFTTAPTAEGSLSVIHTRLGTSPGLAGTVELASFSFVALGGGEATVSLETAVLVSSTGESVTLTDVDSATVTLTAQPDPEPSTGAGTGTPTPAAASEPLGETAGRSSRGNLANTGADATPWIFGAAGAAALIAAGAFLIIRRRSAVNE